MSPFPANSYARWRARCGIVTTLREDCDFPPERLLQSAWQHQRLRRDQLRTQDGASVRVLHPGFGNAEGGPDFRGAVIQIGDAAPQTGDVEVDLRSSGWRAHGHDRNPNFKNVILHVVWDSEKIPARLTLALRNALDASIGELSQWLEHEPARALPENLLGKCSAPLRELADADLASLLREAAQVRLQTKAAQLAARARHSGWEQSLWEGLFRALGYKHNVWPMHALAECRDRWGRRPVSPFALQVRALGLSGLLPTEPTRNQSAADGYLRRVWDAWWRERDELAEFMLPRSLWRLHGIRPANHPQRRLALAAHWLANNDLPARVQRWCVTEIAEKKLTRSLTDILQVERDEFWSWHWTLRSARLSKPQPLLGETRATDLAVNVILPWLWTRAHEGDNATLRNEIERRYFAWPAGEDNSVLRLARQRLLGGRRMPPGGAAIQQGLLQIVRDFCDHSNAICENCRFPELVKNWQNPNHV